jgi:hypothetical protein
MEYEYITISELLHPNAIFTFINDELRKVHSLTKKFRNSDSWCCYNQLLQAPKGLRMS